MDTFAANGAGGVPRRSALGLLGAGLLLAGCASANVDFQGARPLPKGEGIAFGRVRLVWNGEEETSVTTIFGEKPWSLVLLPDGSSEAKDIPLGGDGSFAWHLPAGAYTIAGFHGESPGFFTRHVSGRIFAHFTVAPGTATDIGTLTIIFAGARYRVVVSDEPARLGANEPARHLPAAMPRRKALMELERSR